MPTFDDYAKAADDAKKSLPPEWAHYADTYDTETLRKYAQYADAAAELIKNPQKAVDMVEDYLVTYLGDAIGVAVGAAAGAAIGTCIPVPVLGTAVGAALGIGVAYLRSLTGESPWEDRYVNPKTKTVMPQVEQAIDEWLGPNGSKDTVEKLHAFFHTRDGAISLTNMTGNPLEGPGVPRFIKTGLRKAPGPYTLNGKTYPAGSENAFEMQLRFIAAIEKARQEYIQDRVHESQAHGQITLGAVTAANRPKTVAKAISSVSVASGFAVHPSVAVSAVNLVAAAGSGDLAAKKSIAVIVDGARNGNGSAVASARILTAAQRQALRDDFVSFYLGKRQSA